MQDDAAPANSEATPCPCDAQKQKPQLAIRPRLGASFCVDAAVAWLQFCEKFTQATGPIVPLGKYPGDATALAILAHGKAQAAEPERLGGGSAQVVHPAGY